MRIFLPVLFLLLALVWIAIELFVRKNSKMAKNIASLTLFFSVIWVVMYYFMFR